MLNWPEPGEVSQPSLLPSLKSQLLSSLTQRKNQSIPPPRILSSALFCDSDTSQEGKLFKSWIREGYSQTHRCHCGSHTVPCKMGLVLSFTIFPTLLHDCSVAPQTYGATESRQHKLRRVHSVWAAFTSLRAPTETLLGDLQAVRRWDS